jgi:hypothetical protein
VELQTGIMAGSLPALKPIFRIALETTRNLTSGRRSTHNRDRNGYYGTSGSNLAMNSLSLSGKGQAEQSGDEYESGSGRDRGGKMNTDKYRVRLSATGLDSDEEGDGDVVGRVSSRSRPGTAVFMDDRNSPGAIMRTTEVYVRMDDRGRWRTGGEGKDEEKDGKDVTRSRMRPGMENAI